MKFTIEKYFSMVILLYQKNIVPLHTKSKTNKNYGKGH